MDSRVRGNDGHEAIDRFTQKSCRTVVRFRGNDGLWEYLHQCWGSAVPHPSLRGYYWRTGEMTLLDCVTFTAVLSMVMSRGW